MTLGGNSPTIALEDDEDPVGEREDLLQLERDEQDGPALVALLDEPAVDELDRADVEAARRLRRDQHLRVAVDLAGEDHLLLVAAREAAAVVCGPPPRTSNSSISLAAFGQALRIEPAVARRRRMVVVVQGDVLGEREVEHEPAVLAVLGMCPRPASRAVAAALAGDVLVADLDPAFRDPAQAARRSARSAVAVDAGDADDLAARTSKETSFTFVISRSSTTVRPSTEQRLGRRRVALVDRSSTSRPTIRRASPSSVAPAAGSVSIFLPRRAR